MIFPPSPALSVCDSLDGIEDLDAFLASQGALSHFPTPPLDNVPYKDTIEPAAADSELDLAVSQGLVLTDPIANAFAHATTAGSAPTPYIADTLHHILVNADLPLEVIAIAFSMLSFLEADTRSLVECPPDLLVLAALSLAVSYTDDHAPGPSWYSNHVCKGTHTARRIDQVTLELLATLDWHICRFATLNAYESAMIAFCTSMQVGATENAEGYSMFAVQKIRTTISSC